MYDGKTFNSNVAKESHPEMLSKLAVSVSGLLNCKPFHKKGKAVGQIDNAVVDVKAFNTDRFSVATESQPEKVCSVVLCVPAPLKINEFHTKGRLFVQIVKFVMLFCGVFTLKLSVASESQPPCDTRVTDCDPEVFIVKPFQR